MNETLKLGISLMVVGLIASLALALTNQFTAPKIAEQQELAFKESLNKVIPEADDFKLKEDQDSYYDAYQDEEIIGGVVKTSYPGYSSDVQLLVGINLDNIIKGVVVLNQVETPGLGANVEKESFLKQFIGKDITKVNLKKDGGDIDAITGATITTRAVVNGMLEAAEDCGCGEVDAVSSATTKSEEYDTTTAATNETETSSDDKPIPQNKTETI